MPMDCNLGEITSKILYPPALSLQNFGTWSQYPSASVLKKSAAVCTGKDGGVGEITKDNDRVCCHCGKHFTPRNRIQQFCKNGCRTYYHRKKRAALVSVMMSAYGMGLEHALDVLEKSGISRVINAISSMGYSYDGEVWIHK